MENFLSEFDKDFHRVTYSPEDIQQQKKSVSFNYKVYLPPLRPIRPRSNTAPLVSKAPKKKPSIPLDYRLYLPSLKPNTAVGKNETTLFKAIWGICINNHYFLGLKHRDTHLLQFFIDDEEQVLESTIKKKLWHSLHQLPMQKAPFLFEKATGQKLDTIIGKDWVETFYNYKRLGSD